MKNHSKLLFSGRNILVTRNNHEISTSTRFYRVFNTPYNNISLGKLFSRKVIAVDWKRKFEKIRSRQQIDSDLCLFLLLFYRFFYSLTSAFNISPSQFKYLYKPNCDSKFNIDSELWSCHLLHLIVLWTSWHRRATSNPRFGHDM